jgi:hypothetical protein
MKNFRPQIYTTVKDISDRRRMPRKGKIRGGVKVRNKGGLTDKCQHKENETCMYCTHPVETSYFVCPPEVRQIYGDRPTELHVMLPSNNQAEVFPQRYCLYGHSRGPICVGNGVEASRKGENGEIELVSCPCEKLQTNDNPNGECMLRGTLSIIIPKISSGAVYQIETTSYNSIVDINSGMQMIADMMEQLTGERRFAMVPAILKRGPRITYGRGARDTHYTMQLFPHGSMEDLIAIGQRRYEQFALPAPEAINPAMDNGEVVDVVDEEKLPDTNYEGKLLEMGSPLHKKLEVIITEKKWDRVLLHEYLLQKGKIDIVDGKPSFSTMTEEFANALVNDPERLDQFEVAFNNWLAKQDQPQE